MSTIIAFSAVGSLREEIAPGDFALPSQLIDRTKGGRPTSFFDGTGLVAHAGFSDPYSPHLAAWLTEAVREALKDEGRGVKLWTDKTLVVMEGPQFSTRAESLMYRQWGGDLIGMTALPEAKLAREAEIRRVVSFFSFLHSVLITLQPTASPSSQLQQTTTPGVRTRPASPPPRLARYCAIMPTRRATSRRTLLSASSPLTRRC